MAIKTEWRDPNGLTGISCLSSDTKPDAPAGSICWETDTGARFERDGDTWQPSGTGGAAHVTQSTLLSGEDQTNDVLKVENQNSYELIAASTTAGVPGGGSGAIGDYLVAVIVKANTGTITILDGATTFVVIPASTAVGTRYEFNVLAKTAWKITTPASTEAICIGRFS